MIPERRGGGRSVGLGFGAKLMLLLVLLIVLLQAATFMVTRFAIDRAVDLQLQREVEIGADVWERVHAARNQQLLDRSVVMADDFGFKDALTTGEVPTMLSALANAAGRIGADGGVVLDADGAPLASLLPAGAVLASGARESLLARALGDGAVATVLPLGSGVYRMAMTPVFAPRLVAWVGFVAEFGDADLAEFSAITRLDAELLLGAPSALPGNADRGAADSGAADWSSAEPHADLLRRQGGVAVPARAMRVSLDPAHAVFVLIQPLRQQAMQPFLALGRQVLLLSALAATLALLFALLLGRWATRPLVALAESATRIQRGNYSQPVRAGGSDEFAQLADAFNRMQQGIAEREATIRHQAGHDALTGLPNREHALAELDGARQAAGPGAAVGALMVLNIDRFKEINDTLGHAFGDRVLVEVARRLRNAVRQGDSVARLAADEFLLRQANLDGAAARERAEQLMRLLREDFVLDDTPIQFDLSIGIAPFPEPGVDAAASLRRADIAMYDAKQAQVGVVVYVAGREEQHLRQLSLIRDLSRSIGNAELMLMYQPKIELATDGMRHAEALLRWTHPLLGPIGPDEFIPLAERSGFIHALTRYVLEQAVAQVAQWRAEGLAIGVAVNLSALDLADPSIADAVDECLRRHRVAAEWLVVEVTESAVMREMAASLRNLERIRALGVRISIDDFGTGQSSLAQLKRLPVDELKIDKSFVMTLAPGSDDEPIVRSIIDLAHILSLRVVAEGVEAASGLEVLRSHGCDTVQGYFFSRPLPAPALAAWARRRAAEASHCASHPA